MGQWSTWAEFVDGCEVLINFISPQQSRKLREQARPRERQWDPVAGRASDDLDMDKFYQLTADATVSDWRGLTPEILDDHAVLEPPDRAKFITNGDGTIPYSKERARLLLSTSTTFDQFVTLLSNNLRAHEAARRAREQKNSLPSPARNSAPSGAEAGKSPAPSASSSLKPG